MATKKQFICLDNVLAKLNNDLEYTKDPNFPSPNLAKTIRRLVQDVIDWMLKQPVAEVEEVIHARWVYENGEWICSHCKEEALHRVEYSRGCYMGCETVWSNRCPHCGAHMDEDKEKEDVE